MKKSKKKIIVSLGAKMILGGFIGFFLALFLKPQDTNFDNLIDRMGNWFYLNSFVIFGVVSIISIVVIIYTYRKGKKLYLEVDEEGEFVSKDNYYLLAYVVMSNFLMVFSFAMFGIVSAYAFRDLDVEKTTRVLYAVYLISLFGINLFFSLRADFNIVSLSQKKEPMLETVSDPSSFKFSKEYFSKLDEAQKHHQAMSAFKASKMIMQINFGFFVGVVFLNLMFGSFNQSVIILGLIVFISYLVHQICAFEK